jgi:hypothetical protein
MHTRFSVSRLAVAVATVGLLLTAGRAAAGDKKERDIFDYAAQKAAKGVKKLVFIGDTRPHGAPGNHEFLAAAIYLARTINAQYPDAYAVVYTEKKWPKDLKDADAVIVLLNHGGPAVNPAVKEAVARGAGFMAIHYGVEVNKGEQGKHYLKWLGGYFEPLWSVNPTWVPEFKSIPKHETTHGVKPFKIKDEWYYHMRFVEGMKGVTPVLSAAAPLETITSRWKEGQKPSTHAGNSDVLKEVKAGVPQVMAWAYERPDGGRGFGFTGLHYHANLGDDNVRTLLLNAVAWVSKLPVPAGGVASRPLSRDDLQRLMDEARLAAKRRGI